jgi:hypothetical protein
MSLHVTEALNSELDPRQISLHNGHSTPSDYAARFGKLFLRWDVLHTAII